MNYNNRKEKMLEMYVSNNNTLQEIGDKYDISRERVRQILTVYPEYHKAKKIKAITDVTCAYCGKTKQLTSSKAKNAKFCNMKCFRKYQKQEQKKRCEAGTKICTSCGKELKLSFFYKRGKNAYYSQCKACRNEKIKLYNARKKARNS